MFINNDIKKQLEQLSNEEENKRCFDCGAQPARWISLNNGIFLCHSCSEEHKKIESGINSIKSISLEQWNKNQLNIMKKGGNIKLKNFLEENNIDTNNLDKNVLYNSKLMLYYRNKLKADAEEKLLFEDMPPKNELLEPYNIDNDEKSNNKLDLNEILYINKESNHSGTINNNNKINKENQFIDEQIIDYPKNTIKIDDDQYILAKKNKQLKENNENSALKQDYLLDKTNSEENEKYTSVGSEGSNITGNNSFFQNSGYLGTVGNIFNDVKEKMSEYTIGKGILYIGGKVVEGMVYIGGKIIEKGADIINSEMTRNIVHKAGEGITYISQKIGIKKNDENNDSGSGSYIDISDDIKNENKNYIKNTNSDFENNYNILNDKSENLL